MALSFASSTGNLFNRLGKIFAGIKYINSFLAGGDISAGGLKSIGVFIDNVDGQFLAARQDLVSSLYPTRDAARVALNNTKQQLAAMAQNVVIQQVGDDHNLTAPTIQYALVELIRQMVAAPATVDACTTSVAVTAGTNNGTSTLISSIKGPNGLNREYVQAETLTVTCITDALTGTASAGSETWSVTGIPAVTNPLDWDWPKGSSASATLTSVAADGAYNVLVNGTMETFTVANTPDNWQVTTGTVGTTIKSSAGSYMGSTCLQFVGTGAELTAIYQTFDDSTAGTAVILQPSTVYGFACYVKVSATPSTGVLEFAPTNAAGTIIQDDQAVDQKITKSLTAVSTTFVLVSGFFTTPRILPTGTLRFRVRLSTALDNTKTVNIDNLTLAPATQAYQGGPWLMIVPGSFRSAIGDVHSVAVANDQAGEFQAYFQRCFNIRSYGLQLPSDNAAGETISDGLIV